MHPRFGEVDQQIGRFAPRSTLARSVQVLFGVTTQPEIRSCKCGAQAIFKKGKFDEFKFLPDRNKMYCTLSQGGKGSNGTQKHKWEKSQG